MADSPPASVEDRAASLRARFQAGGQGHVFRFWDSLGPPEREAFLAELEGLDLGEVQRLVKEVLGRREAPLAARLEPAELFPLQRDGPQQALAREGRARGESLLRAGKVACVTVAGGQATRLGWGGPKGGVPVGPVSSRTLFEVQADKIAGTIRRYGATLPWYVLTSEGNHAATLEVFRARAFFGLPEKDVRFFTQGTLPAVDGRGRLLLAAKGSLLRSPDGHGGVFAAMRANGVLEEARFRGIEHFSYFQVDNPLIPAADPLFLGLHLLLGADMSAKFVRKREASEKVGVLVRAGGATRCIEYSDLEPALAEAREPDGGLRFPAGSIAAHAIRRSFAEGIAPGDLPFHRAEKRLKALGEDGRETEVLGVKFERFVFDALPRAKKVLCFEVARQEQFSPVKNADGPNSPASARAAIAAQGARWFERAGLPLPPPGPEGYPLVEVSARFALDETEFLERARGLRVDPSRPVFLA